MSNIPLIKLQFQMKYILTALFSLLFITSYTFSQDTKGNGNIIKKDFPGSNLYKIDNISQANIIITQSENENLTVETDENILQYFEYKDKDGIEISLRGNGISPTKLNVYIKVKELRKIENTGSGNITSTNAITGKSFKLEQTGSGNVELTLSAKEFKAEVTGSGNSRINADAEFCDVEHTGSGNVLFKNFNEKANIKIENTGSGNTDAEIKGVNFAFSNSGSGNGKISGYATNFKLENKGSGDIEGNTFQTESCSVELSGSGDVEFKCNKVAIIELNGSGDLRLNGEYKINRIEMNGSGKLIK